MFLSKCAVRNSKKKFEIHQRARISINNFLLVGDKLMPEMHLRQSELT